MSQIVSAPVTLEFPYPFDVKIPTLGDPASIVEALKVYHFGIDNYENQPIPSSSTVGMVTHLRKIKQDIDLIYEQLSELPATYIEAISSGVTENIITSDNITRSQLKIKQFLNQTAPLLQFQNSSGAEISKITAGGAFEGRGLLAGDSTAVTQAVNTNNTALATTAFVLGQANSTAGTIAMNGTQYAGLSNLYARADHVHPIDTSRSPLAGNASLVTTGTITTGTWNASVIAGQYGGTGVANTGKTITVSGNTIIGSTTNTVTLTTSGNTSVALPTSGTLAITGNPLSQFAATTSAQLAGIMTDETGTDKVVFNTSPTFITSILTSSATFDLLNTTATTINFAGAANAVTIGSGTTNVSIPGNLTVTGTTTYTSVENMLVGGMMVKVGQGSGSVDNNKDRGILFEYNSTGLKTGFFGYDDSTSKFTFIPVATVTNDIVSGTKGTIDANIEWADVLNKPDPVITLGGDLSGSVTLTDLGNGTLTATIVANSVALGTDTTGNYVATVASGSTNSVTIGNSGTESAAVTVSLAQDIHTAANPTFAGATLDSVRVGITAANEIDTTAGNLIIDSTGGTTTLDDDVIISGSLTVNGTTTTINSTVVSVDDINIELGAVTTPTDTTANGGGVILLGATNKTITWDQTNGNWTSNQDFNIPTGKSFKINNVAMLTSTTLNANVTSAAGLTTVGVITSGTWSGLFGAVSGANLTSLTAGNLLGTIPSSVLGNSSHFIGTTSVALNRASANQALTGISSIAFPGSTSGTATLSAQAVAGTPTINLPVSTGNLIGTGDTGTISTAMIADDAVTYAKLQNVSAQYRILGRITAAAGNAEELTPDNIVTTLGQATVTTARQGTGAIVLATSPTLTTPNIGVASGTSLAATGTVSGATLSSTGTITATSTISASGLAGSLLSSTVGTALGATGSAGASSIPARSDHVHPTPIPTQTGNSGRFLTTDGTTPSWAAVIGSVYQATAPTATTGSIWTDSDDGVLRQYNGTAWVSPMNIEVFTPTITTNNYTGVLADQNRMLLLNNSGTAGTFTLPANSTVAYPLGTQIQLMQTGVGQFTITPTSITTATYSSGGAASATTFVISATNANIVAGQLVTGTGFAQNTLVTNVAGTTITVYPPISSQVSGTITFRVGVIATPGLKLRTLGSSATLIKTALPNTWAVIGDLAA